MNKTVLSVIIPCYNEEKRIAGTLDALLEYLPKRFSDWEVIPVDDGSSDSTWGILDRFQRTFAHVYPLRTSHHGKGHAVKYGMLAAAGQFRLMMDADLSTDIHEIKRGMDLIAHHDIIIGSRELDRRQVRTTLKRRVMGRVFHRLIADLVPGLSDTQCGFKLFRERAALDLFNLQILDGWAFDVEILYLAKRRGYALLETPVKWSHDENSKVRAISASFEMLRDVLEIPNLHPTVHGIYNSTL